MPEPGLPSDLSPAERLERFLANPALLARLAREAEGDDPIDWGDLPLDHGAAYELMASQIADMFRGYQRQGLREEEQLLLALGTIVKLATESFVLNQRLLAKRGG
ncbi:MAG: hypothetical protein DI556_12020 [Rhodovulum sulfidophilum]|uniref:Uncharacterized protein n=1 Tax=Rhodovulum sulfidophilum TaxID=35806 RepID=A0A2W5N6Z9_RHOSU|nr:MAG: hypothetical protein DI556_12020 [Rhodovulum sulfidophilum]